MFNINLNLTNRDKLVANNHELKRSYQLEERKKLQSLALEIDSSLKEVNLQGLFVITIRNNSVIDIKELNK